MIAEYVRDAAMTAAIFGFFTTVWFGWAQEAPPPAWRKYLIGGVIAGGLTLVGGVLVAVPNWTAGTVFDEDTGRAFGIIVGIEFGAAALGAVVLAVLKRAEWTPIWIAFVVGVHLFPVAAVLHYPMIHVVGALITLASVVAMPIARARSVTPSAVVGVGAGVPLLAGGLYSLAVALLAY
ncbi:hypothetical protein [Actinoplanes sp. GCM10030250]|uniref:hypothetical protein n=1 Tax=Actinoplanes sp. GCM10030250 TaxID=3273376 RepID=UPI00361F4C29